MFTQKVVFQNFSIIRCQVTVRNMHNFITVAYTPVVDFTKSRKSKISRKCEFQPIKSLEITLTITLAINLRLTTFCEIDPWSSRK